MASVGGGFSTDDFWNTEPFDEVKNSCPYNYRHLMSRKHFNKITAALSFTDNPKPTFIPQVLGGTSNDL
jgi:hypothetical protein